MWDTFHVTPEGTTGVKRARMNTLTHEYEFLRMKHQENIYDMQKRFIHIVNHMRTFGKVFQNENLVVKVCICLNHSQKPKVTTKFKSRDLSSIDLATHFGKLQEHEIELKRLADDKEGGKKKKILALKIYQKVIQTPMKK